MPPKDRKSSSTRAFTKPEPEPETDTVTEADDGDGEAEPYEVTAGETVADPEPSVEEETTDPAADVTEDDSKTEASPAPRSIFAKKSA
jgi:hypothetical protein